MKKIVKIMLKMHSMLFIRIIKQTTNELEILLHETSSYIKQLCKNGSKRTTAINNNDLPYI